MYKLFFIEHTHSTIIDKKPMEQKVLIGSNVQFMCRLLPEYSPSRRKDIWISWLIDVCLYFIKKDTLCVGLVFSGPIKSKNGRQNGPIK
jgi:hypothetical protein